METFKRVPRSLRLPPEMEAEIKRRTEIPGRRMPVAQWIRNAIEKAMRDEDAGRQAA